LYRKPELDDTLMTTYRTADCNILLLALVTSTGIRDATAAISPAYRVTHLETLGGRNSLGIGINASGQVTGYSTPSGDAVSRAFLYDGMMTDLGTLGGSSSYGAGINDSGQVAGWSETTGGAAFQYHAFLWTPTTPNGASGALKDLGTLGGTYSVGTAINASAQVSGSAYTTGDDALHAFLYDGTMNDLGTLGGPHSNGQGINDSGQVTGTSQTTGDAVYHAFLYDGTMHDLGTLGGTESGGTGINDSGQVTGFSFTTGNTARHAFLYDGTMHDLGTLGGTESRGTGINAGGQVIGYSYTTGDAAYHAFLYTSGSGIVDLNSLIDPLSGWELSVASAVNDAGQIAGYGIIGRQTHAFLLTPVPEPASLALLAFGVPLLVATHSAKPKE